MNAETAKTINAKNKIKVDKKNAKLELKDIKKKIKNGVKDGNNCCCYYYCYKNKSKSLYNTTKQWLKNNGYSYEYVEDLWLGYYKISWR